MIEDNTIFVLQLFFFRKLNGSNNLTLVLIKSSSVFKKAQRYRLKDQPASQSLF